ncbi:MAG: SIMPL domain-containing protein [Lachnospiraceae bacterium]|nr:SIMPL domain-containing protein [Lachnospiraceae bacterium]
MKEFKGIVIALIAGICAIISVSIFTGNLVSYKKTSGSGGLTATGSANCDFESDLIVWRGSFSNEGLTAQAAYRSIKKDAEQIRQYLVENGVSEDEMVFSSVTINEVWESEYNDEGDRIRDYLAGYSLYQDVSITSTDIDKIENISRDISGLIESGVQFASEEPEYYYTKLDELKLQLIEDATQNAKARIDLMAAGTGASTGELLNASLGVFQITAQNSNTEYSYGGYFDTSSRHKTASITVKLNYAIN